MRQPDTRPAAWTGGGLANRAQPRSAIAARPADPRVSRRTRSMDPQTGSVIEAVDDDRDPAAELRLGDVRCITDGAVVAAVGRDDLLDRHIVGLAVVAAKAGHLHLEPIAPVHRTTSHTPEHAG